MATPEDEGLLPRPGILSGYIGRFAPSPTGQLHFGSLIAAVGSYLQARSRRGKWLIRMEDLDTPRVVAGSADRMLRTLSRLGMVPDGVIVAQSDRQPAYDEALQRLDKMGALFPCACTRSQLPAGAPYPGRCRTGLPEGETGRSLRVKVSDEIIRFEDRVQGMQCENLSDSSGDFVVRRADGLTAYQLAVVVDDAWQGVTEVVRGADLLGSTARQIHLQRLLGFPTPDYLHLPLVKDHTGRKLSKRDQDDPLEDEEPTASVTAALAFLGHEAPHYDRLESLWSWALENWDPVRVPKVASRHV